jgi:hypothetical protein
MASIKLKGDTSGEIIISAPAVAGTNTLTLPASTGTVITSATAAADVPAPTQLSTASGSAPSYSARAWVSLNGTGTIAINGSGNVSSITDDGTGQYTVNFTTAMPDTNYSAVTGGSVLATQNSNEKSIASTNITTSSFMLHCTDDTSNVYADCENVFGAIFR